MKIGEYVRLRREARDLSIDEVAAGTVSYSGRRDGLSAIDWVAAIEDRSLVPSEEELFQLWYAGGGFFFPDVAMSLLQGRWEWSICRICACTEFDACPEGCGWASPDRTLCTACEGKEA